MNRKEYRNEIKPFTEVMVDNLLENDHKGHWCDETDLVFWIDKLSEEYHETQQIMSKVCRRKMCCDYFNDMTKDELKRLIYECADLANIAMMIGSNAMEQLKASES